MNGEGDPIEGLLKWAANDLLSPEAKAKLIDHLRRPAVAGLDVELLTRAWLTATNTDAPGFISRLAAAYDGLALVATPADVSLDPKALEFGRAMGRVETEREAMKLIGRLLVAAGGVIEVPDRLAAADEVFVEIKVIAGKTVYRALSEPDDLTRAGT